MMQNAQSNILDHKNLTNNTLYIEHTHIPFAASLLATRSVLAMPLQAVPAACASLSCGDVLLSSSSCSVTTSAATPTYSLCESLPPADTALDAVEWK